MAESTIPRPPSGEIVSSRVLEVLGTGFSTLNLSRGFGGTKDPTQTWASMIGNEPAAFSFYFDLAEKDDDCGALLETLKLSVLGRERTIEPADDSAEALRVADFVTEELDAIPAFHQALHALLDAPGYGLSVAEINFDVTAGQVGVLSINDCPQECFAFAEQRWLPQVGPLRFFANPYSGKGEVVPEEKFFVFSYNPRKRNRFGRPLLRRAFWPSWFKRNAIRFWLRFAEKGPGTAAVKYPSGGGEDEQRKALQAAEALIEKVAVAVPSNFELVEALLTSARSQNPAVYERLVQRNELAIARAILGETLTSHGSVRAREATRWDRFTKRSSGSAWLSWHAPSKR
jgi:phage gp29-like protein